MAIRVAINGFGRIGRLVFRVLSQRDDFEVVAINDLGDLDTLAHLLAHDTVHGAVPWSVEVTESGLEVDGRKIEVLSDRNPADLPWSALDVDIVVEGEYTPINLADAPTSEVHQAIADFALAFIPDGATLQTGIGGIPSAIASKLAEGPGSGSPTCQR